MSSELTIDIQLTELGFSSWDFELLEQKETPDTNSSPSNPDPCATATSWSPVPTESHVDEETGLLGGQNTHGVFQSPSPGSHDTWIKGDKTQTDTASTTTGGYSNIVCDEKGACAGGKKRKGADDDDESDENPNTEDGKRKMHEGDTSIRSSKRNLITNLDVHNEEEDDIDYDLTEDEEGNFFFSSDQKGSEQHRCHVCNLTFSTPFLLQEHLHLHTGVRPYCCAECGKQFCHLVNYRAHLRSHAQVASVHCVICTATFATKEDLQKHLDTNHFEDEFYQCDFCKRIFSSMQECKKHVQQHKQQTKGHHYPNCDCSFCRQTSEKGVFICTDCGQAFSKKVSLLRHSFHHLGLLPYTCVRCKRHFRLPSLYSRHECKPEHIQCVACLVIFQSQGDFEKHKMDTGCWGHQTASPAKTNDIRCMECGQVFDSSEELKKHAGTHQRVMRCSECGMGFRSSLMLMSHMGGHAAQRPCLCKDCGLGFSHQQAFDSHLKTCGVMTPPEGAMKKPKPMSKKKKSTIAPKSKDLQIVTQETQKDIPQQMHPVPLVNNQTKSSKGMWTLTLDKKPLPGVPLVMFLPVPATPTSECTQNPPNLVASPEVSDKSLSSPHANNIPVTSTSNAVSAGSDKSVLLQSIKAPGANILIPLTTEDNKMRWTVLHEQSVSSPVMIRTAAKEKAVCAFESKQTLNISQLNTKNEPNKNVLSSLEILNTMQNKACVDEIKPHQQRLSTSGLCNPVTPVCLVKVMRQTGDDCTTQIESRLENGNSILETVEMRSGALLKVENNFLSAAIMGPYSPGFGSSENKSGIKKEPCEEH
ncbi:zinc finger protein 628 [Electrophorus electricus]|uniref:zinc finger protein 628 n=1 Tax=Electrophorus electricus TaxID=8005 RepID=UPI0015D09F80|nr:zinc finger protein 628 [Electrophorus electricus]